jgi:ABC-type Mn2+/Zn2+ transport system ATPase subunit
MNQKEVMLEPARLIVENAGVRYGARKVLEDVSFQVPQGSQVAIVGPNGAGKSTLFKAIIGLLPLDNGKVFIHGLPLARHMDCVAYIPQREEVDWKFPVSVFDVVLMGRFGKVRGFKQPGKIDREIALHTLKQMDMLPYLRRPIGDLSGGQQQRVFIARALAQQPHILLMDEPFSGVDAATQESTLKVLESLKEQEVTVMITTHDLDMARQHFDSIMMLNHRVIAYGPPGSVFTAETMRQTFSGQVLFLDGAWVVDQCCGHEDHSE